jgi:hypothetical protein
MVSVVEGADRIMECLATAQPCLIGRNGSTELQAIFSPPSVSVARALERFSGIFPADEDTLEQWKHDYIEALMTIKEEPIVAGWYEPIADSERTLLSHLCPTAKHLPLRSLEPYYVDITHRWTWHLADKTVAVVSAFAETIRSQVTRASEIWGPTHESLLPSTTKWVPIQTGFPPSLAKSKMRWPSGCTNYSACLDFLETAVLASKAEICLIGCGALGMLLGARLKKKGLQCVVMGGALQVLFGIKGQRWATHSVISKFWNEAWVWPSENEVPEGAMLVERGCYWK